MTTTRQLLATATLAATALFSAGAFAQEATPDTWTAVSASQTRAAVVADLATARQTGLTKAWSAGYMEPLRNPALRAEVKAQTVQAIESGELRTINAVVQGDTPTAGLRVSQAAS